LPKDSIVGRWAGDEVYLVGDYDESQLFREAYDGYRNISKEVIEAWNGFIDIEQMLLEHNENCSCNQQE